MAFTTRRGRPPRDRSDAPDYGTPELRSKQAFGLTAEPIDLCLAQGLILDDHHWCGLHLRWLYTLRYGAPVLTTRYTDMPFSAAPDDDSEQWRRSREEEYHAAIALLRQLRRYEPIMRLCVFNELPAFLSHPLRSRAWGDPALAERLSRSHAAVREGFDGLARHWVALLPSRRVSRLANPL